MTAQRPVAIPGFPDAGNGMPFDVLLIDDNADFLVLIRRALESGGLYKVTAVPSPEEAESLLGSRTFDLVLLDYRFPRGRNGLQVIRKLKEKSTFVPIVMVTAFGDESLAIQVMREGALDFVPKTSDFLQALPDVVARAIDRGRIIRERIATQSALASRNRELQLMNDLATAIGASTDPESILAATSSMLQELLGAAIVAAHLLDDARRRFLPAAGERVEAHDEAGALAWAAIRTARSQSNAAGTLVAVPLVAKESPIGAITALIDAGETPSDETKALLDSVGKQAGVAIEHARLYATLRSTQEYLQDVVGNAGDEVVTIDVSGRIITWNAGAEAIYGWTPTEIAGRRWDALWPVEGADEARELARRVVLDGSTVRNHETVRLTRDGHAVDILLTLSPLRGPGGAVRGVSCLGKNVTVQKQLQMQLLQSEKMATVGHLISGIAHELNNPLTAVLGYSQLVAEADLGDRLPKYLEKISVEAIRCQRIVHNLLSFARKHEPCATRVDVNAIVRETLGLSEYDLRVGGVDVVVRLDEGLPSTLADAHQIQQVFVNLTSNAQHAMKARGSKGRLIISTRVEQCGASGRPEIVTSFCDNGLGIPEAIRRKIFDPFFTTKAAGEGTGLGLSLSYGILKEHGGSITVGESDEGGARFDVRLPVMAVLAEDEGGHRGRVVAGIAPAESAADDSRKRILVVDDEAGIREMVTEALRREGHEIVTAAGGGEALTLLGDDARFDLIIADLRMADVGGDSLLREVRRSHPGLADRVVFASGDKSADACRTIAESGHPCLTKPFGVEDVRNAVTRFFTPGARASRGAQETS